MVVPVRVRADIPEVPFEARIPVRFWKVTAALAMRLVVEAVPETESAVEEA